MIITKATSSATLQVTGSILIDRAMLIVIDPDTLLVRCRLILREHSIVVQ